jgi:hypothetical protein
VLLFTDKNASTVLYKGLSWSYARRLAFGEVRSSEETAALQQYGVAKMPTLLVVKVGQPCCFWLCEDCTMYGCSVAGAVASQRC